MATKAEVRELKQKALNLALKGATPEEIAIQIGKSGQHVRTYLREKLKEIKSHLSELDKQQVMSYFEHKSNLRLVRFWNLVQNKNVKPVELIAALKELRAEDEFEFKRAERFGLVPVLPQVNVSQFNSVGSQQVVFQQINVNEIISKFAEEEIKEKKVKVLEDGSGK